MDILFIANEPPYPLRQSYRTLLYYLARELSAQHHALDLITFYREPEDLANVPRYEYLYRRVALVKKPTLSLRMLKRRLNSTNFFPTQAKHVWSTEMWDTITRWTHDKRYDYIQVVGDVDIYEYAHLLRSFPNMIFSPHIPTLRLAQQLEYATVRQQRRALQQQYNVLLKYQDRMYQPFKRVGVTTPKQAEAIAMFKPLILPLGVDTDYYTPTGHDPQTPTLLFIGNYANVVNLAAARRLVHDILPAVQRQIANIKLYLVGSNLPAELASNNSAITATGYVPDLRPYFELSTVMVAPLGHDIGFRQNILKSLAMMTPVVATSQSLSGIKVIPDKDCLVAHKNDEFARAIVRIIKDDELRSRLQLNGSDKIQRLYNWQSIAQGYANTYKSI